MLLIVSIAAMVGLAAGSYVRVVVVARGRPGWRALARHVPLPAARPWTEVCTAAVFALLAWRFGLSPLLVAYLYLGFVGVALALIDARTKSLPDPLTLPSYPIGLGLLAVAAPFTGGYRPLLYAMFGMAALWLLYAVQWMVKPEYIGLGDVKLAGVLGLFLGRLGLDSWVLGAIAGPILGGLFALGLLLTRKATAKSEFPYGPFLLVGTLGGILFGDGSA